MGFSRQVIGLLNVSSCRTSLVKKGEAGECAGDYELEEVLE